MLTRSCTSHKSELKNNTQTKTKNTHKKNLRIDVTISWGAPAYVRGCRQWLRVHTSTLTHLSILYKEQAEGILAAEVEHINVILHSYLQDRQRERETHYDCDFRHCGCGQDSQTLLRADRIQFIISGKINGPLFLQYFQRMAHTHTHTHHRIVGKYMILWSSLFFDILLLSLSLSLFILLFKTLCGFAKVGFSSGAWSSCLHTSMWTSNMHEYLKGKLTKRIEDAHWQFEKTEWVYQSWTIILKNNCP